MEKFSTNLIIIGNTVTLENIRGVEVFTQLFSLALYSFPAGYLCLWVIWVLDLCGFYMALKTRLVFAIVDIYVQYTCYYTCKCGFAVSVQYKKDCCSAGLVHAIANTC